MARNNENDWELIRQEMEIEAGARRFERRMRGINAINNMFVKCFPEDKRNSVLDIETLILSLPLIALLIYISIRMPIVGFILIAGACLSFYLQRH